MKKIISMFLMIASMQIYAQDSTVTYGELGEKLGGSAECQQMIDFVAKNSDYKAKYGETYFKNAKGAFERWKHTAENYISSNWCSPEDYIYITLQHQATEERFLNCLSIHQLQLGLDKTIPEQKEVIVQIDKATVSWYCSKQDYQRLKALADKFKK